MVEYHYPKSLFELGTAIRKGKLTPTKYLVYKFSGVPKEFGLVVPEYEPLGEAVSIEIEEEYRDVRAKGNVDLVAEFPYTEEGKKAAFDLAFKLRKF